MTLKNETGVTSISSKNNEYSEELNSVTSGKDDKIRIMVLDQYFKYILYLRIRYQLLLQGPFCKTN